MKQILTLTLILFTSITFGQEKKDIFKTEKTDYSIKKGDKPDLSNSSILYIVDGKAYTEEYFKQLSLNPDNIESINILKDKKDIAKFTKKQNYKGVINIILKKD